MIFCYNCGEKISDNSRFCPECGTDLRSDDNILTNDTVDSSKSTIYSKKGLILTNSTLLSRRLSVSVDAVLTLINAYITHLKQLGMCYELVDLNTYTRENRWYDYQRVLLDIHKREVASSVQESNFLFIIGGNDVIPVPVINNHIARSSENNKDTDIETDQLYAYPYGPQTQHLMERAEIYKAELLYLVSRLPLASDATFDDLKNFLQRTLNAHAQGGIQMTHAYAQTDPHWERISSRVVNGVYTAGMLNHFESCPAELCNGRMWISPPISYETLHKVFLTDASIFMFNLHGSDQPDASYYSGQIYPKGKHVAAFIPNAIRHAKNDNIVAAECCYGAKFVGYDKEHSMLHSALMAKTLLFFGSSRIAYGAGNSNDPNYDARVPLSSADLICAAFIDSLLELGVSGGEAALIARKMFFVRENNPYGNRSKPLPYDALTLSEFNLYGDPMLGVDQNSIKSKIGAAKSTSAMSGDRYIAEKESDIGMEVEDVTNTNNRSLLQRVRGAVDANLDNLTKRIGDALYSQYNIEPRKPKQILRVKYKDGDSLYSVVYEDKSCDDDTISTDVIVTSDAQGEIKSVVMSK